MEENNVSVVTDPVEEATTTDTQIDNVENSPTVDTSGHEEQGNVSEAAPTTTESSGTPELSEAERREEGKLQQVQRENAELKEAADRYKVIEERALRSPDTYKRALMDYNDYSEAKAMETVEELRSQGLWNNTEVPVTNPQASAPVDVNQIVAQVEQNLQVRNQNQEAFKALQEAYPELKDASDVNRSNLGFTEKLAGTLVEADPTLSYRDATLQAYGIVTKKTANEVAAAKEAGRIEGIAQANSVSAATSSAPTAQQAKSTATVPLKDWERASAKAMGMTDKEYFDMSSKED